MILALAVAFLAVAIATLRGGSLRALAETEFSWPALVFVSLGLELWAALFDPDSLSRGQGVAVLVVTNLCVVVFLALNHRLPGMLVAALGLALNVIVIAANGAMPVSPEAARVADTEVTIEGIGHEPITDDTVLPWLADVIPLPGLRFIVSTGDVVLALGIGRLAYAQGLRRPATSRASY
jgi:Family of unknown function (DUF5317)